MAQPINLARSQADPENSADPFPYQIAPPSTVRSRRLRLFMLTGIAAYLLALLATLPARLLLDRADEPHIWLAVSGTVWNGEAALSQGHAVRWRWAPLASLTTISYSTHLQVIGADTELTGIAAWRPSGIVVTDLKGNASATLVSALAPTLPFLCDFPMRVNIDRLAFGGTAPGAAGEIMGSAGSCTARNSAVAASVAVPPLVAEATINVGGSNGWIAARGNRADKLISFAVTPSGATSITVSPSASMLIPGIEAVRALAE
jgi:hypothetical protein